jgi:hypothetical protein
VLLIVATFPILAFLLLELHPLPPRCPLDGEQHNKGHDEGCGKRCSAAEPR